MKITVFGAGYVGMSLATVLCVKHDVMLIDIDKSRVDSINSGRYPVCPGDIKSYLSGKIYSLHAATDPSECGSSDYVIIATPTNYDPEKGHFDTSSVENVLESVTAYSPGSVVVIRSTVPIGYTREISARYGKLHILFSPEFLREGNSIHDSLNPSRVVVGYVSPEDREKAEEFAGLICGVTAVPNCRILVSGPSEAESIKLFSNTFLAMRVAFFNELDSYAEMKGLDPKQIIDGVCMDPRIGEYYNNPSFGYGGYCLPKDTKQLLSNYHEIPNSIIRAVVESNQVRKEFIAEQICKKLCGRKRVGIYRLVMKAGSDNFRESSVLGVLGLLKEKRLEILIYEPLLSEPIEGTSLINDFDTFVKGADMIVANRMDMKILPYSEKVYCRDLFCTD